MLSSIILLYLVYNNRYIRLQQLILILVSYYIIVIASNTSILANVIAYNNNSIIDSVYYSIQLLACIILLWLLVSNSNKLPSNILTESIVLHIIVFIGLSTLASSSSLFISFVSIELQSIALFIVLVMPINMSNPSIDSNKHISRIGLLYYINASIATAIFILGYGIDSQLLTIISLLWKLGSIPMHIWMITIIDALDSTIAALMLTISKLAILVLLALISLNSSTYTLSSLLYLSLSMLNLIVASIISITQYRYLRLLAWTSIAQLGYILLIIYSNNTTLSLLYYELYSIFTVLLILLYTSTNSNIVYMHKLMNNSRLIVLVIALFSIAGIPSAPLYWAKLELLLYTNTLSIVIVLIGTLLSSIVYIRIIKYASFYNYATY